MNICTTDITFTGKIEDLFTLYTIINKVEGDSNWVANIDSERYDWHINNPYARETVIGDLLVETDLADLDINDPSLPIILKEGENPEGTYSSIWNYGIEGHDGICKITISQSDSGLPCLEIWDYLISKLSLDVKYVYTGIEAGCEVYETTDPQMKDKYLVDITGEMIDDDIYKFVTKDEAIEILQDVVSCYSEINLDTLLQYAEEMEDEGKLEYVSVHKLEFMTPEKLDNRKMYLDAIDKLIKKKID